MSRKKGSVDDHKQTPFERDADLATLARRQNEWAERYAAVTGKQVKLDLLGLPRLPDKLSPLWAIKRRRWLDRCFRKLLREIEPFSGGRVELAVTYVPLCGAIERLDDHEIGKLVDLVQRRWRTIPGLIAFGAVELEWVPIGFWQVHFHAWVSLPAPDVEAAKKAIKNSLPTERDPAKACYRPLYQKPARDPIGWALYATKSLHPENVFERHAWAHNERRYTKACKLKKPQADELCRFLAHSAIGTLLLVGLRLNKSFKVLRDPSF